MLLIGAFINSIIIIFFNAEASGSVHIFIKCLCWMLQKLCPVQFRMVAGGAVSTVGHYSSSLDYHYLLHDSRTLEMTMTLNNDYTECYRL